MNRRELQTLAAMRLREAQALYRAKEYSGAYYLAGYAVECALKACIAKQVKRHDFPERQTRGKDPYIHDIVQLAVLARLLDEILDHGEEDGNFKKNWDIIKLWNEQSRYRKFGQNESRNLIDAIIEVKHGVMPWVQQRW